MTCRDRSEGAGGARAVLGLVCGCLVDRRPCRFCFMCPQRVSVDVGKYLLTFW